MKKEELCLSICITTIVCLFQSGLFIPSIYFGFTEENDACQEGLRGGINLSDWLKIFGLEKLGLNAFLFLTILFAFMLESIEIMICGMVSLLLDSLFNIAWWIWGVVIVATAENRNCVAQGSALGVMAIVNLALGGVWFIHVKTVIKLQES